MTLDKQIDELYQLPPDQFTAARNELAKTVDASDKAAVRALKKPSIPAWAVNQLYWRSRPAWDALVRAATELRTVQRAALRGRAADVRKADAAHREALTNALRETMRIASAEGQATSAAVKEAVMRTLQALPADVHPGRLDAPLEAAGFGVLGGVAPLRAVPAPKKAQPAPRKTGKPPDARTAAQMEKEARRAEAEARKEAERARKEAERERREEERREAAAKKRIAQLAAVLDRARKAEDDVRERLDRATREREKAEKELARARS